MIISATGYSNHSPGLPSFAQQKPPFSPLDPEQDQASNFTPKVNQSPRDSQVQKAEPQDPASNNDNSNQSGELPRTDNPVTTNAHALTQAEMQLLDELQQADSKVRSHEMAHIAAGGRFITSGANFTYKRGPDGKNYAVAGEVGIDTSPIPGDPQATIQKMRQIKSSALAPANPSAQDLKVASKASSLASKAMSELMILTAKDQAQANEKTAFGNLQNASDSYTKVNELPDSDATTFQIAV